MRKLAQIVALVSALAGLFAAADVAEAANVSAVASGLPPYHYSFDPLWVTVPVGGTVQWTNEDPTFSPHTAISVSTDPSGRPLFDLAGDYHGFLLGYSRTPGFGPRGASVTHGFAAAGTYGYYCRIHPGMVGTVGVADRVRRGGRSDQRAVVTWATGPPPLGGGYDLQRRFGHRWKFLLIDTARTKFGYRLEGGPFRSRLRFGSGPSDHTAWSPPSRVTR